MHLNKYTNEEYFPDRDMKFPVLSFDGHFTKSHELQLHWHNDLELIKVKSGEVRYVINGYETIGKAGDLIIVNQRQVHQASVINGDRADMEIIIFNYNYIKSQMMDVVNEEYLLPLINTKFIFHNLVQDTEVIELFDTLKQTIEKQVPMYQIKVKALMFQFIAYMFENHLYYTNKAFVRKNELDSNDVTRMTIEYIHKNFSTSLSLDDISDSISVSKFHLCRLFKKTTGITINSYINNYRLAQAARMIKDTKKNITTIAYDCGYNNPSYFISKFKDQYGVSPNQYKKA